MLKQQIKMNDTMYIYMYICMKSITYMYVICIKDWFTIQRIAKIKMLINTNKQNSLMPRNAPLRFTLFPSAFTKVRTIVHHLGQGLLMWSKCVTWN